MEMGSRHRRWGSRLACAAPVLAVLLLLGQAIAAVPVRADDPVGHEFEEMPASTSPAPLVARDLRELLALVEGDVPLRVTLSVRGQVIGHPWRVYGDTLLLVPPAEWKPGRAPERAGLPGVRLDDIVLLEQSRSGARAGAGWGAKSGALVVGGLGLLVGTAVSALSDGDGDATTILALGAIGAAAGALAGGGIGAGVGALGHDWVAIWPPAAAGRLAGRGHGAADVDATSIVSGGTARRSRLALEGGWSFDDAAEHDGRGPGVRLGIVRRVGGHFEMGPFAEYHDLRGLYRYTALEGLHPDAVEFLAARTRLFALGLDVRTLGRGRGPRPCGTTGLAWCLGDGLFVAAHAGAGVRWQCGDGHELTLLVRRHFGVLGSQPRESRFWSIAGGITFGP